MIIEMINHNCAQYRITSDIHFTWYRSHAIRVRWTMEDLVIKYQYCSISWYLVNTESI